MEDTKLAKIYIETDLDCRILRFGKEIGIARAGQFSEINLSKGRHMLTFVGLDNDSDNCELVYTVNDVSFEDFITIKLLDKYIKRKYIENRVNKKEESKLRRHEMFKANINSLKRFLAYKYTKLSVLFFAIALFILSIFIKVDVIYFDTYLSEGYMPVAKVNIWGGNGKYGYINKAGKLVIPFEYSDVSSFSEGLAAVKFKGKWGFIDKSGKAVILFKYRSQPCEFREGYAAVIQDGKWGFVDKFGNVVIPFIYDGFVDYPCGFSEDGLAAVQLNGKCGHIDKTGNVVVPIKYDYVRAFTNGFAEVNIGHIWGLVDTTGQEVLPVIYNNISGFSEGLACVEFNDKWGFVDETGAVKIPFKYDDAHSFSDGLARVRLDRTTFFIDQTGEVIDYFDENIIVGDFVEGLAPVASIYEQKWGFINKSLDFVISPRYKASNTPYFHEGLAAVKLNGKYGYIDLKGNVVIPFIYDSATSFWNGVAEVTISGETMFINRLGQEIYKIKF